MGRSPLVYDYERQPAFTNGTVAGEAPGRKHVDTLRFLRSHRTVWSRDDGVVDLLRSKKAYLQKVSSLRQCISFSGTVLRIHVGRRFELSVVRTPSFDSLSTRSLNASKHPRAIDMIAQCKQSTHVLHFPPEQPYLAPPQHCDIAGWIQSDISHNESHFDRLFNACCGYCLSRGAWTPQQADRHSGSAPHGARCVPTFGRIVRLVTAKPKCAPIYELFRNRSLSVPGD